MSMRRRVVETEYGRVAGYVQGEVVAYKGIPWGAPPLGERRWRAPEPAQPWSGDRDCADFAYDPMQLKSSRPLRGGGVSEDCLSVNVWAPARTQSGGAPVMVWLYGGGFSFGSGSNRETDGSALATRGVVVVAPNSRTGIFAWLAHPLLSKESPDGISGNYRLLDNIASLEWVQRNIGRFGGDPNRVTVFGCSSGAAAITAMLMMPRTKGLFARIILESAGSFRPLCRLDEAEHWGTIVGDNLDAMREMKAEDLLALGEKIGPKVRQLTTPRILRPILDGKLIAQDEMDAFRDGNYYAVPAIVGSQADEGGYYVDSLPIRTVEQYRTYLEGNFGPYTADALLVYPGRDKNEVLSSLSNVFGDTQFTFGARGLARALRRRETNVFRYLFAQPTQGRLPVHGGEQAYVFGTGSNWTDEDRSISDTIQRMWTGFAGVGDPFGADVPEWPHYDVGHDRYLVIDGAYRLGSGWRSAPLDFLEFYYERTRLERRADA